MSFDWTYYLFFARRILDDSDVLPKHDPSQLSDAGFRSAISRAYYAAFHKMAKVLNISEKELEEAPSAHSLVWARAENDPRLHLQQAARVGKRLKKSRSRADYNCVFGSLSTDAENAIDDVRELYRLVR